MRKLYCDLIGRQFEMFLLNSSYLQRRVVLMDLHCRKSQIYPFRSDLSFAAVYKMWETIKGSPSEAPLLFLMNYSIDSMVFSTAGESQSSFMTDLNLFSCTSLKFLHSFYRLVIYLLYSYNFFNLSSLSDFLFQDSCIKFCFYSSKNLTISLILVISADIAYLLFYSSFILLKNTTLPLQRPLISSREIIISDSFSASPYLSSFFYLYKRDISMFNPLIF